MLPEQRTFLDELFRTKFNMLELHAFGYIKNRADAKLLVQDAFHIACQKIDDVMSSPNPTSWMKATVRNMSLNYIKRKNRQRKLVISVEELTEDIAAFDTGIDKVDLIEQCRQAVSEEDFMLLRRVALEGATCMEAAQEFGISLWACYKRLQRIEERLRRVILDDLGDYPPARKK